MKHIKRFEEINEEINLKGLAAGALMALTTACSPGEVDGVSSDTYVGDIKVTKIKLTDGKYQNFVISGKDSNGKLVEFDTDELTFNVGDSIHVDFSKEIVTLLDKEKGNDY